MKPLKVVPRAGDEPAPLEILERSIIEIAAGMKAIRNLRLKREAIILLLSSASGVGKREVRAVLDSMDHLETIFLKPVTGERK